MRNLKLAVRSLARSPFVTVVAILSLALGIGANAAIFSLFNEMLLRPLPVPHPEQLVDVEVPGPNPGNHNDDVEGYHDFVLSYPMFRDLEREQKVFTGLAAHRLFDDDVAWRGAPLYGRGLFVSGSYFPALEISPAFGRLLGPADDQSIGGAPVAVLDYAFWQTKLGGDPRVIGDRILVNGQPMQVVGIAPRGFSGTTLGAQPNVYIPISMRGVVDPIFHGFTNRRWYWIYVFGRLAPGVTTARATQAMDAVYQPIIRDVEASLQIGMTEQTLARFRERKLMLHPGRRGESTLREVREKPLLLLFGITAVVLLIACANIANLLLARGANRATEMAVRLSLGATRRQLVGQLLVEACVLAVAGGIASLLVARSTLGLLAALLPQEEAAGLAFSLDAAALGFTTAISIGTGILFGIFPAMHASRADLSSAIRAGTGKHSGSRGAARFRTALVTSQIALSMVLLVAAGLFVESLRNLGRVNLGMDVRNVVSFQVAPMLNGYDVARSRQVFARLEEQLAALPGVAGVTAARVPLLADENWDTWMSVEGFRKGPDTDDDAYFNSIGAGFFKAMHVPVVAGREFTAADVAGSPRVAIVNEAFTRKFGLGHDAIGKMIGAYKGDTLDVRIVGVVKDTKYSEVRNGERPIFYEPYQQDTTIGRLTFYVRATGDPTPLMRLVPAVVSRVDPTLPVSELRTMDAQIAENISADRLVSSLSAAFATLATLLAAIGLYGVLAYSVAQRTREIGVRMALGADTQRVRALVLRQVARMTIVGGAIGIGAAVLVGRAARSLLFQLKGYDPVVMTMAGAVLAVVAFTAGYLPARRASAVDPVQALRYE